MSQRACWSAAVLAAGAALLLTAYLRASAIPRAANQAYFNAFPGGMVDVQTRGNFDRMSADSWLRQNDYLGGAGLVLLGVGCWGLLATTDARPRSLPVTPLFPTGEGSGRAPTVGTS